MSESIAVELTEVSFSRPQRGHKADKARLQVLDGIDLQVATGETVAIVGPNGCGKSTLLELACGLIEPDVGTVHSEPIALMPQRGLLMPWASALDNAALGLRAEGASKSDARDTAREWFARLGLEGFESVRPNELSGGMRQRVALARTLMADRPVIALDEPFAALDALSRIEARNWLLDALPEAGRTVLLVTHDVEEAAILADRILVLSKRPASVIAEIAPASAAPRDRTSDEVLGSREQILAFLGVEG